MNVICIMSDTFRFDNLTAAGNTTVRTPNLDKFAEKSVLFTNYVCASFPTLPNRIDTFTGTVGFPHFGWGAMPTNLPTIAEILTNNGYHTQIIHDPPNLEKNNWWLTRGFEASNRIRGQEGDVSVLHMNDPIERHLPEAQIRTETKRVGAYLADVQRWINWQRDTELDLTCVKTCLEASKWLDLNYKRDDMFLWVDIFDPHEPWDAPDYMAKKYDPDYDGVAMSDPNYGLSTAYSDRELQNMKAQYYAEAEIVDKWIGVILQKVEDVGWMDNTIILFVSDHGFQFGEHGHVGKGDREKPDDNMWWPMYNQLRHVPLMMYVPGVTKGAVSEELVQPQDITPTLLDFLGVKTDVKFDGTSFKDLILDPTKKFDRKYAISGCHTGDEWKNTPSVMSKAYSYLPIGADGVHPELYDRLHDMDEEHNVVAEHPEIAAEMQKVIEDFYETHGKARDEYKKMGKVEL